MYYFYVAHQNTIRYLLCREREKGVAVARGKKIESADAVIRRIGRRIAELRVDQNLTQQEMADALDVAVQRVRKLETGAANITVRTLVGLAAFFGVPLGALFEHPKHQEVRMGRPVRA